MSTTTVVILVLIILLFAGGPYTGWHSWGYYPSGIIGILLIIVLMLLVFGRL